MAPIAIAPPAAPASTAINLARSIMKPDHATAEPDAEARQKKRAVVFRPPPATGWALVKLLDVGVDRQVGRKPGDEAAAAPVGLIATVDRVDARRAEYGRVIVGEGVAVGLAQIGV